jgi:hypothetical protein
MLKGLGFAFFPWFVEAEEGGASADVSREPSDFEGPPTGRLFVDLSTPDSAKRYTLAIEI